jgi:hypothetical protein
MMTELKSRKRRDAAMLTAFAAIVAIQVMSATQSQQNCVSAPVNVTTPPAAPDAFLTASDPTAVCVDNNDQPLNLDLSTGGFVIPGMTVKADSAAQVTGYCDIMDWQYAPPPAYCRHFNPQTVYLMGIDFWKYPPTEPTSHAFHYAPYQKTYWNTQVSGGGTTYNLDEEGNWGFGFQSQSFGTNCTASTKSNFTNKYIQVIGCLPIFRPDSDPPSRVPLTSGVQYQDIDLKIAFMSGTANEITALTNTLTAAAGAWNVQLHPYGLNLNLTFPGVSCTPADSGHCVQVYVQNPPQGPNACAGTNAPGDANGNLTGNATIWVNPLYDNWIDAFRTSVLAHEIGHLFDLKDQNPYCYADGSIMNTIQTPTCRGTDMSGLSDGPELSDVLAVVKGTYGNAAKKICWK